MSGWSVRKKRGRRTKPAPATPAKGRVEQYLADAPRRGRGSSTASTLQSLLAQFGGICGKQFLTLRASFKLSHNLSRGGKLYLLTKNFRMKGRLIFDPPWMYCAL